MTITLGEFWTDQGTDADVRRRKVAALAADGMSDGQIATHLGISTRTVLRDRKTASITPGVGSGGRPFSGMKCTVCGLAAMTRICRGCAKKQQPKPAGAQQPLPRDQELPKPVRQIQPRLDTTWRADALCAQTDPEIFHPEKGGSTTAAKRVCKQCPVRELCLEDSIRTGDRFGIRGGLSERERRPLIRKRLKELEAANQEAEVA